MEAFTFSLRLGGRIIGRMFAHLDTSDTLACSKGIFSRRALSIAMWYPPVPKLPTSPFDSAGNLTEAAERILGHKVVIKRFMVTVWGRTGYLQPEQEYAPLAGEFEFLHWNAHLQQPACSLDHPYST